MADLKNCYDRAVAIVAVASGQKAKGGGAIALPKFSKCRKIFFQKYKILNWKTSKLGGESKEQQY